MDRATESEKYLQQERVDGKDEALDETHKSDSYRLALALQYSDCRALQTPTSSSCTNHTDGSMLPELLRTICRTV